MAQSEAAFFREILALASAGHTGALIRLVHQRSTWITARAPKARPNEPYGRLTLYRDPRGEIMVAGWQTDSRCAPHDHGDARGIVIVAAGKFKETRYRHNERGLVRSGHSSGISGSALPITSGLIHDMHCEAAGATLHVYLPAIQQMRVYDERARTTWIVNDEAGAWIPRDRQHVIATEAWPSPHDTASN